MHVCEPHLWLLCVMSLLGHQWVPGRHVWERQEAVPLRPAKEMGIAVPQGPEQTIGARQLSWLQRGSEISCLKEFIHLSIHFLYPPYKFFVKVA